MSTTNPAAGGEGAEEPGRAMRKSRYGHWPCSLLCNYQVKLKKETTVGRREKGWNNSKVTRIGFYSFILIISVQLALLAITHQLSLS